MLCVTVFGVVGLGGTLAANASADYSGYFITYKPDTQIVMPPSVIAEVSSKAELDSLSATKKPAIAILHINAALKVIGGGAEIATLQQAMATLNKQIIPAIFIADMATLDAFTIYASSVRLTDAFVVSADKAVAKESAKKFRGVIDYAAATAMLEIRDSTNINNCRVAVVDSSVTAEQVRYLQQRLITVWVRGELYGTLAKGVNGIITSDYAGVISALEKEKEATLARAPFVVAHRGYSYRYPENTVKAAEEAIKVGADIIECDIVLSKDNVPVVVHDEWMSSAVIAGYPDGKSVQDYTVAEIKQWHMAGAGNEDIKVATFEELLLAVKGTNAILLTEVKSVKQGLIPAVKALVDKHKMSGQMAFISFERDEKFTYQMQKIRELMPEITLGYLTEKTISLATLEKYRPYNATCNTRGDTFNYELVCDLRDRGQTVWPWTYASKPDYSDKKGYETGVLSGVNGITTDCPNFGKELAESITLEKSNYTLKLGESMDIVSTVKMGLAANDITVTNLDVLAISGNIGLKLNSEGKYIVRKVGVMTGALIYRQKMILTDEDLPFYNLYSAPFTITATAADETEPPIDPIPPIPEKDPPAKGCGSNLLSGINCVGLLICGLLIICAAIITIRKPKSPKSKR